MKDSLHFERIKYEKTDSCSFGTMREYVVIEHFQYHEDIPIKTRIYVEFHPSTHWSDPVDLRYQMGEYNDEWRISYSSGGYNDVTNKQLANAMSWIWNRVCEIVSKTPLQYEDEVTKEFRRV